MVGAFRPRRLLVGLALMLLVGFGVYQAWRSDSLPIPLDPSSPPPTVPGLASAPAASSTFPTPQAHTGDEEHRSCLRILDAAEEHAMQELRAANPDFAAESEEPPSQAQYEALEQALMASGDPEHQLTATLYHNRRTGFGTGEPAADDEILRALRANALRSRSRFLAWHALRACHDLRQACPDADLAQDLAEVDGQNAASWVLVADLRYQRGDRAGALKALQRAARAPASTWYWTESIASIERSLAARTNMSFPRRINEAFGLAAFVLPAQAGILAACRSGSAASPSWAEACLALAATQAERNETTMAQMVAHSFSEQTLKAMGDTVRAAEVAREKSRRESMRNSIPRDLAGPATTLQGILVTTDPAQFHAYLSAIQRDGETLGARNFLRQELPRLLDRANLLGHEGAEECIQEIFAGDIP